MEEFKVPRADVLATADRLHKRMREVAKWQYDRMREHTSPGESLSCAVYGCLVAVLEERNHGLRLLHQHIKELR